MALTHDNGRPRRFGDGDPPEEDLVWDMGEALRRLFKGLPLVVLLAFLGAILAAGCRWLTNRAQSETTSVQISLSFPRLDAGLYPDGSAFAATDLVSPAIVAEAVRRESTHSSSLTAADLVGRLGVAEIPLTPVREVGERPTKLYALNLTLPAGFPLAPPERVKFLTGLSGVYQEALSGKFSEPSVPFGHLQEKMRSADCFEYPQILESEARALLEFVHALANEKKRPDLPAGSPSPEDLAARAEAFARVQVEETLALIRREGYSPDPHRSLLRLDHRLGELHDQEQKASAEEALARDLLAQVMGQPERRPGESGVPPAMTPGAVVLLDRTPSDSPPSREAMNLLVQRALDAGMEARRLQAAERDLLEQKNAIEGFLAKPDEERSAAAARGQAGLSALQSDYDGLVADIRRLMAERAAWERRQAVSVVSAGSSSSNRRPLRPAAMAGLVFGAALGIGLSVLGLGAAGKN